MLGSIFESTSLPAIEQTVQFAQRRHELLATNIANADTPGYQTRDLSVSNFQSSLKEAIDTMRLPGNIDSLPSSSPSSSPFAEKSEGIGRIAKEQAMDNVRESMKQIMYHDGSDVGLETQVTEISKNQMTHNMAIAIMRNQFQQLNIAIRESVNV